MDDSLRILLLLAGLCVLGALLFLLIINWTCIAANYRQRRRNADVENPTSPTPTRWRGDSWDSFGNLEATAIPLATRRPPSAEIARPQHAILNPLSEPDDTEERERPPTPQGIRLVESFGTIILDTHLQIPKKAHRRGTVHVSYPTVLADVEEQDLEEGEEDADKEKSRDNYDVKTECSGDEEERHLSELEFDNSSNHDTNIIGFAKSFISAKASFLNKFPALTKNSVSGATSMTIIPSTRAPSPTLFDQPLELPLKSPATTSRPRAHPIAHPLHLLPDEEIKRRKQKEVLAFQARAIISSLGLDTPAADPGIEDQSLRRFMHCQRMVALDLLNHGQPSTWKVCDYCACLHRKGPPCPNQRYDELEGNLYG